MSKKRQSDLSSFFKKQRLNEAEEIIQISDCTHSLLPLSDAGTSGTGNVPVIDNDSILNDINHFLIKNKTTNLTNQEKLETIEKLWKPPSNYNFPLYTDKKGYKRNFQKSWLENNKWLYFSHIMKGALCAYCVIFSSKDKKVGKGHHQEPGKLVSCVLGPESYKDAKEILLKHSTSDFHKNCMLTYESLRSTVTGGNIITKIDSGLKKTILDNRERLKPIIQTVKLCGRLGLPLRGHIDSGRLDLDDKAANDGVFRGLIRYRANSGDSILKKHIMESGANATYMSAQIQNEIIHIYGSKMKEEIVQRVLKNKFYSVLADETTDINQIEQFSLCVRYYDEDSSVLREDFLEFVPVTDTTGENLANVILTTLRRLGLDLSYLRGQGYDGAAAMRGKFRGVQNIIKQQYPKAVYTHCINLCLADSSKIPSIRNCMGAITEVNNFFHLSATKTSILEESIKTNDPTTKVNRLKSLCETRWVQRHDAVLLFKDYFVPIVEALESIQDFKANSLLSALTQFQFVINLVVLSKVLSMTHNLSVLLQSPNCDLSSALDHVTIVFNSLTELRRNEDEYKALYSETIKICQQLNISEAVPRLCGRQSHRSNVAFDNAFDYFKVNLYYVILDDILSSLNERFLDQQNLVASLQKVLPKCTVFSEFLSLKPALNFYKEDLITDNEYLLEAEWKLWKQFWVDLSKDRNSKLPKTCVETLTLCNKDLFPNVFILLQLLATLPVTTCSVERSFSTLKRLKTYLRATTSQNRLNGLAMLNIHKDIDIDDNVILNNLAEKNRKLNISLH